MTKPLVNDRIRIIRKIRLIVKNEVSQKIKSWFSDKGTISKVPIIALSIILIVGAIALASTRSKSQKDSPKLTPTLSDWKTYQNEKHGYKVRYPRDWRIKEDPKEEKGIYTASFENKKLLDAEEGYGRDRKEYAGLFILILKAPQDINFDLSQFALSKQYIAKEYTEGTAEESKKIFSPTAVRKDVEIDGIRGVEVKDFAYPYGMPGTERKDSRKRDIFIKRNGKLYEILSLSFGDRYEEYNRVLDNIVESFRFITISAH